MLEDSLALAFHPVGRWLRLALTRGADLSAPRFGRRLVYATIATEHYAVDAASEPWNHVAAFDVIGDRLRIALDRVAEP